MGERGVLKFIIYHRMPGFQTGAQSAVSSGHEIIWGLVPFTISNMFWLIGMNRINW